MARLIGPIGVALAANGLSTACGFAAVGVAFYPHPSQLATAAALFAGVGFITGALRLALPLAFEHLPAQARLAAGQSADAALSPLAAMARATLAAAAAGQGAQRGQRATAPAPGAPRGTAPATGASRATAGSSQTEATA